MTVGTEKSPLSARKFKWDRMRIAGTMFVTVGTAKAKDLGMDAQVGVLWVKSPKTGAVLKFERRMPLYKVTGHDRAVIEGYRFGVDGNGLLLDVIL